MQYTTILGVAIPNQYFKESRLNALAKAVENSDIPEIFKPVSYYGSDSGALYLYQSIELKEAWCVVFARNHRGKLQYSFEFRRFKRRSTINMLLKEHIPDFMYPVLLAFANEKETNQLKLKQLDSLL